MEELILELMLELVSGFLLYTSERNHGAGVLGIYKKEPFLEIGMG